MPNSRPNALHAQRLKAIRPFVNFNYNLNKPLSAYAKRKILRYWREIDLLQSRDNKIIRPKRTDRLKIAQRIAGHDPSITGITVAFIPVSDANNPPSIKFTKNNTLIVASKHIVSSAILFDPIELALDPAQHVIDLLADRPDDSTQYSVITGKWEIIQGRTKSVMPAFIEFLVDKYSNENESKYYQNWLIGLNMHEFRKQSNYNTYQKAKLDAREQRRKDKLNTIKQDKRQREVSKNEKRNLGRRRRNRPVQKR